MIRTVPSSLQRTRELLHPALQAAVDRLSPEVRRVAQYHLGFADADGTPARSDGGKAVRPALAFLSAEAAGAPASVGLPGALAVELVHNFSLLHDDVMDQDLERRHRPTAWALFGVGPAILAGDALHALAHQVLLDADPRGVEAAAALARATADMIAGQGEDLGFESRLDVSVEECLQMGAHKTGALLSCAASIGAILAGASPPVVGALAEYGVHLGLSFQAVDDVLGIWGRPEMTGKPSANDLRQHKKSLPVVAALGAGGPSAEQLARLLSNGNLSEDDGAFGVGLVEEAGGRRMAISEAERQLDLALAALERVPLEPGAREQLAEVARFVAAREF
ncbi:MAG: polyprenyl synthetase family protein [Actinomycetota bacterium]|nr:polyprenyl synthetase family protein [Actinomycetota bacterium]